MKPSLQAALLLGVVALIWPAALHGPFQFDDWNVIVDQPAVHSLSSWWVSMPGIRPLLKLSYAIDWQTGGGALPFHLTNLLLHAANTCMVWMLVRRWPGLAAEVAGSVALWVAMIFALHPVQAEAVAYISGRSMSMMAFFWLAAALAWLRGMASPEAASARLWQVLSVLMFAAALGVRETALSLPLMLWVWQRAEGQSWLSAFWRLWPMWMVVATGVVAILSLARYRQLLGFSLDIRSPLGNLTMQVDGLAYLFTRPLILLQTNIDPDISLQPVGSGLWMLSAAFLLAMMVGGIFALRRSPVFGLALLWPFILLLPTNSLIARLDLVADRHLYLAMLGPAVILVCGIHRMFKHHWAPLATLSVLLVVLVLSLHTRLRLNDFSTETALWRATAERSPAKARVWNNLGYGLLQEGDPVRARECFQHALRLQPDHPRAAFNLERAVREIETLQDAASRR